MSGRVFVRSGAGQPCARKGATAYVQQTDIDFLFVAECLGEFL